MDVLNPYTEEVIGSVNLFNKEEVVKAIQLGVKAEKSLEELSSGERAAILHDIVRGIEKNHKKLVDSIIAESGKPFVYAKAEVDRAIQTFTFAAEEAKRLPHELLSLDQTEKEKTLMGEVHYFPKGLVFGISPFNFPLNLAVHKVAPAIATGCPILLKPSSKTPLTMELLADIIAKTDLPKGGFQLLHCSRELGDYIIVHDDIKLISFTGSPSVGWDIKSRAGKKKVVLELGGNAAAIISKDAVIKKAIDELLVGAFAYSGQVCIHTQRIYVQNTVFDSFLTSFITGVEKIKNEDPKQNNTKFSVMIDEQNAKRVKQWVDEAMDAGAKCLIGGGRRGTYVEPTVLTNVPKGQKVRNEEVFGPVVIIESFDDLDNVIDEVNDSRWGLQASIFTDSIRNRDLAFTKLDVGGVIHNRSTTFRVDNMPYGGIKDSGFGREGVKYAMHDYLEPKLLVR